MFGLPQCQEVVAALRLFQLLGADADRPRGLLQREPDGLAGEAERRRVT
ncbi:MAG: hypothetical protein ACRDMK_07810 [Gaiellaceae bacterium]